MFNAFRFPYSDFNKLNLDWCMSKLPVDITQKCSVIDEMGAESFYVCKFGDLVFVYVMGTTQDDISVSENIIKLPVQSKFLQGFYDFAYMEDGSYDIKSQNGFSNGDPYWCSFIAVTQGDE